MAQMGHTSANLTLSVYARQMLRRDGEPERLQVLVAGRSCSGQRPGETSSPNATVGDTDD